MIEQIFSRAGMLSIILHLHDKNIGINVFAKKVGLSYATTTKHLYELERIGVIKMNRNGMGIGFELTLSGRTIRDLLFKVDSEMVYCKNEYNKRIFEEIQTEIRKGTPRISTR